jgi:gas vesicle protein
MNTLNELFETQKKIGNRFKSLDEEVQSSSSIQSGHDVRAKIKEALDNWKDFTAKHHVLQSYVSSNPEIKSNVYFVNNVVEEAEKNTAKILTSLLDYQQSCAWINYIKTSRRILRQRKLKNILHQNYKC